MVVIGRHGVNFHFHNLPEFSFPIHDSWEWEVRKRPSTQPPPFYTYTHRCVDTHTDARQLFRGRKQRQERRTEVETNDSQRAELQIKKRDDSFLWLLQTVAAASSSRWPGRGWGWVRGAQLELTALGLLKEDVLLPGESWRYIRCERTWKEMFESFDVIFSQRWNGWRGISSFLRLMFEQT